MKSQFISSAAGIMIVCILICSCKNQSVENKVPGITEINFEAALADVRDVKLSDIVSEIRHIPLETSEVSLVGPRTWQGAIPAGDYFLVPQRKNPLMVFDSDGHFVRTIGSVGRGPGEYPAEYYVVWCPANELVYIKGSYSENILKFHIGGEYRGMFRAERSIITMEAPGNGSLVGGLMLYFDADTLGYNYIMFDTTGRITAEYEIARNAVVDISEPGSGQKQAMIVNPVIMRTPSGINIDTHLNDTIFSVDNKGNMKPSVWFNKGKYNPGFPLYQSIDKIVEGVTNFIHVHYVTESGKNIFIVYSLDNRQGRLLYDKEEGIQYAIGKTINDIDGSVQWNPGGIQYGNISIMLTSPVALKKNLVSGMYDVKDVRHPDRNRKFREMVELLKEDDNPVLTVITMN